MAGETPTRTGPDDGLAVAQARPRVESPPLYRVVLLNDDYTPMDYVVTVLEQFFGKAREEAVRIMLHIHQKGLGLCGVFPRDVAETKVRRVLEHAREHRHPLQCTMEAE
jgi:ATP-dependent Clp protease adaptor protein ClpS